MKQPKPCKSKGCDRPRFGNSTLCRTHYYEHDREKKLKAKLRKQSTKKFQESRRKTLHKKCWKLMSEIVRRTGANPLTGLNECYTCRAVKPWKELQAGHRWHRRLDFDFRNIKPQCQRCNGQQSRGGLSGNLGMYERRLIEEHGLEWSRQLERDANAHVGYSVPELESLITELEGRLDNLK